MIDTQLYAKKNLSEIVVDFIKHKILTGKYKEGDHISEVEVAEELNISRAPVREGIKELQNQGLIKFIPRKGNYVTRMTLEDVKEVFDIRLLLEYSVIEILINEKKLNEKDFELLNGMVNKMVEVAKDPGDLEEKTLKINELDMSFHKFLWDKSGSKRRVKILTDMYLLLQVAMVFDTKMTGNLEITASDHYIIIECLKEGNISECKKALKNHIISYRKGIFK